jgi:hypothetical protein
VNSGSKKPSPDVYDFAWVISLYCGICGTKISNVVKNNNYTEILHDVVNDWRKQRSVVWGKICQRLKLRKLQRSTSGIAGL